MDNHVLEGKVLALLDLTAGTHDFAFLCTAFSGEQPGELAIAVLRLCEAGKLQAGIGGVRLAEDSCIAAVPQLPAYEPVSEDAQQPISEDAEEEEQLSLKFEAAYAPQYVAIEEAEPETAETDFGDDAGEVVVADVLADGQQETAAVNPDDVAGEVVADDVATVAVEVAAADSWSETAATNPVDEADSAAAVADVQPEAPQSTVSPESAGPACDDPQEPQAPQAEENAPDAPAKPLDELGKALDGDSGAPVADTVPRVFAHDRIAMLRLPKKCEARFLEAGITTVRELVAALDDEDLASQVKPEYVSAAVDALRLCAVEPSYQLSARQLKTLTELSRSKAFAFGVYGGIIDVDAVCQREGLTISQAPESQVADLPVEQLGVPTPTLRKLHMLNLPTVGDVERIGEQGLVEQYGLFPQVAAVIFNQVERLHNQQARERRGEKSPLASFDSKYSKEALSVLRSVQNEIERLEYPVSREELHVLLAPMAAAALAETAAGNGMMTHHAKAVRQVLEQVDELPETCNALLESVWRRARIAIGDLGEGQSHISVTIPYGGPGRKRRHWRAGIILTGGGASCCSLVETPSRFSSRYAGSTFG